MTKFDFDGPIEKTIRGEIELTLRLEKLVELGFASKKGDKYYITPKGKTHLKKMFTDAEKEINQVLKSK